MRRPRLRSAAARGRPVKASEIAALLDAGPHPAAIAAADGRIRYCNAALASLFGSSSAQLVGQPVAALLERGDAAVIRGLLREARRGVSGSARASLRLPEGSQRVAEIRALPLRERAAGLHLSLAPLDLATPTLTGLPGRASFVSRLGRTLKRARRGPDVQFAVLVASLDGFKLLNDSLGREKADELLRQVGERFLNTLRPGDEVAQLDGDEFALLVDRIPGPEEASRVASRLQAALDAPYTIGGQQLYATAGIGITLSAAAYGQPEDMLRDATTAMYRAKRRGPRQHELFDQRMRARAIARLQLETDLRQAAARREFRLCYQPVLSLSTGLTAAFEALLRWQHPRRGLLMPDDFLRAAEQLGLMIGIGSGVLEEACRQLREWQAAGPGELALSVSTNLTAAHLSSASVVETLGRALERSGLPGRRLIVEVTETVLFKGFDEAIAVLRDLKAMGIRVHLDDFGTGYSSLSYLNRLPADAVKIDPSFVSRLGTDPRVEVLVRAIVELAHNLGMEVVAEGIETKAQSTLLIDAGCDFGQGHLFAPALEARAAEVWLKSESRKLGRDRLRKVK